MALRGRGDKEGWEDINFVAVKAIEVKKYVYGALGVCFAGALATSCANMGNPSGGPRDEDPPRYDRSDPGQGARDVSKTKMTITFDELINVKDAFTKVVTSPVTRSQPKVSSLGRTVHIEFDSLAPNTTYTIDFADAIEDNNEGNKLQNFAYTFSTGAELDTLRISGRVFSARNLEPQQGMLVGVYDNLADSAFTTMPFLRVAKTDDRGQFTIRGLRPGTYRVFALEDRDNDYKYSTPEETIAFYDYTVEPTTRRTEVYDTLYTELGEVDTVVTRQRTQYLPNDILLRSFASDKLPQYLAKYERQDSTRLFLKFNAKSTVLPKLEVVDGDNFLPVGTLETRQGLDSLVYWLRPDLVHEDSLRIAATYLRTDSLKQLEEVTDTLRFYFTRPKPKKKDKKKKISAADSIAAITTTFNILSETSQDVDKPLLFDTPTPLARFDSTGVHLSVMVDSVWRAVPEPWRVALEDSLAPRRFVIDYPWDYDSKYRLEIDSLAATDIYGKPNLPLQHEFATKKANEYCSLTFVITGIPQGMPSFVELLNTSDAVERTVAVKDGEAYFPFLKPGKYYARIIEDVNGNGLYDTGDYERGLQPELAYYYPKVINIKKNWDKEEVWAVFDTPVDMMKPLQILKNKPEASKRKRTGNDNQLEDEEDEDYFDPTRNPFDPNDRGSRNRPQRLRP